MAKHLQVGTYKTPHDLIDDLLQQRPITSYVTPEEEVIRIAKKITSVAQEQFGEQFSFLYKVEGSDHRPPFALSWEVKPIRKAGTLSA